jgi:hypothetical protein
MRDPAVTNERKDNERERKQQEINTDTYTQCENNTRDKQYIQLVCNGNISCAVDERRLGNRSADTVNDLEHPPPPLEGFPLEYCSHFRKKRKIILIFRARRNADGPHFPRKSKSDDDRGILAESPPCLCLNQTKNIKKTDGKIRRETARICSQPGRV